MERIFHTWDKWECYPAGFYENSSPYVTKKEGECCYRDFLRSEYLFSLGLKRVIDEWKNSCEHYLSNEKMNRIAWLGQAACCVMTGLPSCYRTGYFLLSKNEAKVADGLALLYLNMWLTKRGESEVDLAKAGVNAHANIY